MTNRKNCMDIPGDMTGDEIVSRLTRRGITQAGIARDLGVSVNAVQLVIRRGGTSTRIMTAVAEAICVPREMIWPSRFLNGTPKRGRPLGRGLDTRK